MENEWILLDGNYLEGCFAAAAYETTWNIKAKRALVQMSHCPCVQEVQK